LYDNFRSGLTGVDWALYSGQALGDPGGFFAPGHVSIVHGTLNIAAYRDPGFGDRWVSGGVTTIPAVRQIYGKYLVRARIDPGEGIIGAVVLWPLHGSAPPEINLAKNVGYNTVRNEFTASLLPTGGLEVTRSIGVDWSDWHTIGLEWTPRRLVFLLDGRPWASIRGGGVPSVPMRLAIQSQAATCTSDSTCPGSVTPANVRFQVAWVRIYAYRGPR
jgi:beta-glucanase (GH16 family)